MPSTRSTIASAAHTFALLCLFTTAAASMDHQRLHKRGQSYVACYSSATPLEQANTWNWQSQGYCSDHCDGGVIGLTAGDTCYCGNEIPADGDKVDDSNCDITCTGWPSVKCGGDGFWSVWLTGKGSNIQTYSGDASSSTSSNSQSSKANYPPSQAAATVVTSQIAGGSTVIVTVPASKPTGDSQSSSSSDGGGGSDGSNTAGIAAGVVVGVVALSAIVAAVYFFLRHRKQKQAEADFKQRTQVADFMRGSHEHKPPSTGYSGMSDSRLDPEAGQRNSVGSLADNQDYSRRILRVANPDDS